MKGSRAAAARPTAKTRRPEVISHRASGTSVAVTPLSSPSTTRRTVFEGLLQLAPQLQKTGIPFPVVADVCEALVVQFVAAIEGQLEVLVGEDVVCPDGSLKVAVPATAPSSLRDSRSPGGRELRSGTGTFGRARPQPMFDETDARARGGCRTTHHPYRLRLFCIAVLIPAILSARVHRYRLSLIQSVSASGPGAGELAKWGQLGRTRARPVQTHPIRWLSRPNRHPPATGRSVPSPTTKDSVPAPPPLVTDRGL